MKVSELPARTEYKDDNYFVIDGATSGTRRIRADLLPAAIARMSSHDQWTSRAAPSSATTQARALNNFRVCGANFTYRGKFLGTSITTDQWKSIDGGSFLDLCLGDYWVLTYGGVTRRWRIVAFDYERNHFFLNDTSVASAHWIGVMPDTLTAGGTTSQNCADYGTQKQKLDQLHSVMGTIVTNTFGSSHLFYKPEVIITESAYPVTTVQTSDYYMRLPSAEMLGLHDLILPHSTNIQQENNTELGTTTGRTMLPIFRFAPDRAYPEIITSSVTVTWLQNSWSNRQFILNDRGPLEHHESTWAVCMANIGLRPIVWLQA